MHCLLYKKNYESSEEAGKCDSCLREKLVTRSLPTDDPDIGINRE